LLLFSLLSLASSLVAMASNVSINEEDNDNEDVGQDDKESLHAPKLLTELPVPYPMITLLRRRRFSNGRWQRFTRRAPAMEKPYYLVPTLYN
jgi:hypothetical protein